MKCQLTITDHAVLRWLERVEGIDVKAIRRRIARVAKKGVVHRAARVKMDGVSFCLKYDIDGTTAVTTTYSAKYRPHLAVGRLESGDDE